MSTLLPAVRDFQSDARKIDERRPPWVVGATLYALVAVIMVASIWASVAKVDQIVVAPGKLVTTASTIVAQPLEIPLAPRIRITLGSHRRRVPFRPCPVDLRRRQGYDMQPRLVCRSTDGHREDDLIADPGELTVADEGSTVAQKHAKQRRIGGGIGRRDRHQRHECEQCCGPEAHEW